MYEYFLWIFLRENRSLRLWNVAYLVEHMACTKFQKYAVPVRVCVSGVLCECTYSHPHPYAYLRDCLLKLIFCALRPRRKSVNDTNNRRANGEMGKTTGKSRSQKPKQCNKRNYNWNVPGWELVKGPNNNNMFVNWHTLEFINNSHTDGSVVLSFGNYTHELVLDSCSCSFESFFFPEQPIQCSVHVFISIPNISNCRAVFHWIACSCGT